MVLDSQPQDNLVITAVREEVTQCKVSLVRTQQSNVYPCSLLPRTRSAGSKIDSGSVPDLLQECAEKVGQACKRVTDQPVGTSCPWVSVVLITLNQSGWRDLTAELASTKRALQGFRLPELVLTSRWETGPHPVRDFTCFGKPRSNLTGSSSSSETTCPTTAREVTLKLSLRWVQMKCHSLDVLVASRGIARTIVMLYIGRTLLPHDNC